MHLVESEVQKPVFPEERNNEFNRSFWGEFMVGKPGSKVKNKDLSIPNLKAINALLNGKETFIIEHKYVPTPERAGVPIYELATLQRRVYFASKLKLLRYSSTTLTLFADGPRNGSTHKFLLVKGGGRDVNNIFTLSGDEAGLKREYLTRPDSIGILECHGKFDLSDAKVTITSKRIVISYKGSYFPGEIIIHLNTNNALTLVGDESESYAGSYTYIPTQDVGSIKSFEKRHKHISKIRNKRKSRLRW